MEDFPKTDGVKILQDDDLENVTGGSYGDWANDVCGQSHYTVCSVLFGTSGLLDC